MAVRPLVFGVLMRDKDRNLRVKKQGKGWVVEDTGRGRARRARSHPSLDGALRDLARTWRHRLH
jgi:hypothetical protein